VEVESKLPTSKPRRMMTFPLPPSSNWSQIGVKQQSINAVRELSEIMRPEYIKTVEVLVGVVGIEPTNYMEIKEFCGAPRPSKSFKGTQRNP